MSAPGERERRPRGTVTRRLAAGGARDRGERARCVLALGGAALALALAPAVARAGSYTISDCPAAPGAPGDSGPWSIFGAAQSNKATCAAGAGDWIGPRGASMAPGTIDGVQVAVPAGSAITIRAATVWWAVPSQSSGATTFALASSNGGTLGEYATPLIAYFTPSTFTLPSASTVLELVDYCSNDDAGQGCSFGPDQSPDLQLFGSMLTLEDPRPPSGSVTGGGLAGAGVMSGQQSLAYRAEDGDSGVRLVQLRVDGQTVAQNDYLAKCPYTNFLACPATESDALGWNTASVPDGQHELALVVANAAQETSVIADSTITTQNGRALAVAAGPSLGAGNGRAASRSARLALTPGPSVLRRSYAHRSIKLAGRLSGPGGAPIAAASIELLGREGQTSTQLSQVLTRADGTFSARVAPGPSRTITLGYRAFSGEDRYDAEAHLQEQVGAGVSLHVTPRSVGPSSTIQLSGRVAGPLPHGGVVVELLVHYLGQWEPFRAPRTNSRGRFSVSYRFQGARGRFPFRAEVPAGQSAFPYVAGVSRSVDVQAR